MKLRKALKSLVLIVALFASAAVSFGGDAGKGRGAAAAARIPETSSRGVEVAARGTQLGTQLGMTRA